MYRVCLVIVVLGLVTEGRQAITGQEVGAEPAAQTWTNVRYLGGGSGVTRNPKRRYSLWADRLTVSSKMIELRLQDGQSIEIDPARVTALTYNGRKFMREELVGLAMVSPAAGLLAPLLAPRSTEHYIVIEYQLPSGLQSGILLRAHKGNHAVIFQALKSVTKITEAPADTSPPGQPANPKKRNP